MAKRPASSSDAKGLAKVLRGHFHSMEATTFSPDFDHCLERHMDFFVDLWVEDKYASQGNLVSAMKLVWPGMAISDATQTAKSIRNVTSAILIKKRKITTGLKNKSLSKFLQKVGEQDVMLPISSKGQGQDGKPPQAEKPPSSLAALYGVPAGPAGKAEKPESCSSIAALYGVTKGPEVGHSQVTVSDAADDLPVTQMTIQDSADETAKSEMPTAEARHGYYFDHGKCCLVRTTADPTGQILTEMSTMKPGDDGFAVAVFEDGEMKVTEIPNLDLFAQVSCLKRPAAATKKPAAAFKKPACSDGPSSGDGDGGAEGGAVDGDGGSVDGGSSSESSSKTAKYTAHKPTKPGGLERPSNLFTMVSGTVLKLGKFTGQSYITYKEPGKAKFTLLVACSDKQATRTGKSHQQVMEGVWAYVTALPGLPTKEACKEHLMELLSK